MTIKTRLITVAAALSLLTGCQLEEETIMYDGQQMPISEAEERIADLLEVDNPELDLEVDIMEEQED